MQPDPDITSEETSSDEETQIPTSSTHRLEDEQTDGDEDDESGCDECNKINEDEVAFKELKAKIQRMVAATENSTVHHHFLESNLPTLRTFTNEETTEYQAIQMMTIKNILKKREPQSETADEPMVASVCNTEADN